MTYANLSATFSLKYYQRNQVQRLRRSEVGTVNSPLERHPLVRAIQRLITLAQHRWRAFTKAVTRPLRCTML